MTIKVGWRGDPPKIIRFILSREPGIPGTSSQFSGACGAFAGTTRTRRITKLHPIRYVDHLPVFGSFTIESETSTSKEASSSSRESVQQNLPSN